MLNTNLTILSLCVLFAFENCESRHEKTLVWETLEDDCELAEHSSLLHNMNETIPEENDKVTRNIVNKNHNVALELPLPTKEPYYQQIIHTGYELSYNLITHCPNWVAWDLTAEEVNGQVPRSNDYRADYCVKNDDDRVDEMAFSGTDFDRGHMCPAGDMKWDSDAMSASFYMTNMCPQAKTLNQNWWERLERACRRWAEKDGIIYICCGPIFYGNEDCISCSTPIVKIPSAFYKVVLSANPGRERAIGFYYRNDNSRQPMGEAVRTVDEIEEITGFDFFYLLDDSIEERIESSARLSDWD